MENIKIDNIKKKENIREDYGDLTELTASIAARGVRQPILINSKNEIIDGYRRVIAAKAAGLEMIPYVYADNSIPTDETTEQMIAGIFQKNLNPVEEGKCFKNYMENEKFTAEQVAKRIGKRVNYVEKRLEIAKLPVKVQAALIKNKIQMGHALLLARLSRKGMDELMKEIIGDDLGVQEAKDNLSCQSMNLKDALFCKGDCKDCIHNGSKQAELFETGAVLNGICMNSKCFNKKLREFVEMKKEEFADVLHKDSYSTPEGYVDGDHSWYCKEHKITEAYKNKCREKRENYLVSIYDSGSVTEYFKKRPQKTESGEVAEEENVEKKGTALLTKVSEFKTQFLIEQTKVKVQPGTIEAKALGVLRIIQQADFAEKDRAVEEIGKLMEDSCGPYANVKNIFEAEESVLDNVVAALSKNALRRVDLKNLVLISRNFGVDIKTDFAITEDYLKMYTKDQLNDLIKEFKLEEAGNVKKAELIEHILQQNLKGKVPQIML